MIVQSILVKSMKAFLMEELMGMVPTWAETIFIFESLLSAILFLIRL
jgi:hypothetical protein